MRYSGICLGAFLSIALLAACSGNRGASSPTSFVPPTAPVPALKFPDWIGRGGVRLLGQTRLASGLKDRILYSFQGGSDGVSPYAGLLAEAGGSYVGTTGYGGSTNSYCGPMGGCGTIFTLTGSGNSEKILYAFTGPPDGVLPGFGSLISDERGALYGTTGFGGTANFGIVYKLTPSGSGYGETILHSFQGGTDGELPAAGVVADARGNLYGTTDGDGSATFGTVFELKRSASSYVEKVLHNFQNDGTDGEIPSGTLTLRDGTLYGTTVAGGTHGDGTVFMLATMGSAHKETVLYSFGSNPNDGQQPFTAVTFVHGHDLYTTTSEGGAHGLGAVAKLAGSGRSYRESVLYSFGGPDGADPQAPLLFRHGSLYGTTYVGGAYNGGAAFRVSLNGTERVLHSFGATGDGFNPDAGLIVDSQGRFLSTTQFGPSYGCSGQGYYGCGTVFRVP